MISNSRVSVIMPVYNNEKYLCESIESILNQTYKNFEFIVIDDGSSDDSHKIINGYASRDNRIIVISREHKGLVYSLNEGINMASGKYVARMDADDISMPARLEKQVNYLDKNKSTDILGTFIEAFGDVDDNEKNTCNRAFNFQIDEENIVEISLKGTPIAHPSVMFRSDCIRSLGGYDELYKYTEDYELWIRALNYGYQIKNIQEKLLKYRIHNGSKSVLDSKNKERDNEIIKCKLKYVTFINNVTNYIIWGASNGGNMLYSVINESFNNMKLCAYIDKYKGGEFNGVKIVHPDKISDIKFDYIFIATQPGKEEAEIYLNNLGYKRTYDYTYIL
ncbi:glycosyltransferase [Clostridium oryzae]|uniref:Putative glycosyltransferase EpsE n=1 Tax=Clostridium oryzae TaxID=1450648 RepID=A0A1V4I5J4_9CLOT|nr:glycosyltransferase [Clostridium oryzae]OPJ54847.1 putative glycosyltransferase EpsE [Clostridium oryzae]